MAHKENKKVIERKIKKYIQILQDSGIAIWRLYLFGSYATNRFNAESDINLAVFLDKDKIDSLDQDVRLMRLRRKVDLRIEPHSFALSDFKSPDPFVKEILTSGKRIV